ncbi:MAG: metal-dependent transcriptional regulator [Chloroflexi bacterium]|nr:metal-dependent transcriptional regulator [Chloroflexota bacterium]
MSEAYPVSDSIQMYLVNILRLSNEGRAVPLSKLAATLEVTPVSVNQMCRKLQSDGLVTYVPYKGVSITLAGEQVAVRVLRRHRLWEVFLVEHLHMRQEEAHETACLLEHATPDEVIERLDGFLRYPRVNPDGEPIPVSAGTLPSSRPRPLLELHVGQRGHCVRCTADEASAAFLHGQGLRPGVPFRVLASASESLLLEVAGRSLVLDLSLATTVLVEPEGQQGTDRLDAEVLQGGTGSA